jgi:1-acyl-sn-glycerol-3-phosphate acyltransferase
MWPSQGRDAAEWCRRAAALIPLADRVALLSPPILLAKFVRYAMSRHKRDAAADDPEARNPEFVDVLLDLFRALGRYYFRLEVRGVENVPAVGPALLVGNHNGALLPADGFFAALAIRDRFGPHRAMYALAHDFLFFDPMLRRYALQMGALRAGHEGARRVFARGSLVLVYPGSDIETFRPWRDRGKIVLGDRKGYLRLAIGAGVPIVPVVSAGTHEQLIILSRGDRLAQALHMRRWVRTDFCPIVLSVPWGLTTGFLPYLPLPAQTTLSFGAPIAWPSLTPKDAEDPQVLDRAHAQVEATMQSMLAELMEGRVAFLGQSGRHRRYSATPMVMPAPAVTSSTV